MDSHPDEQAPCGRQCPARYQIPRAVVNPRTRERGTPKGSRREVEVASQAKTSPKAKARRHVLNLSLRTERMPAPRMSADSILKASVLGQRPIASLSTTQFVVFSTWELARMEPIAITPMSKVPSRRQSLTMHKDLNPQEVTQKPKRKHLRRDPPEETPDSGEGALHLGETAGPGPAPW